ncbi:MAG: class E sortase [Acidimicrobiales bacterium]
MVERPSRTRLTVVAATVAIVLVATAAWSRRDDGPPTTTGVQVGLAAADLATSTTRSTTTEPSTVPPPTAPPVPIPDPLPADPYAPTPAVVLGRIRIPELGVDQPLQEGMTLTAIDRGPSHWPGTAAPGELGNVVVAGHRSTHSKPFEDLDRLTAGDRIVFDTASGSFTYEVRGVIVVPEDHIGIAAASAAHTATLFACHPKGSATHRIVVKARLLGADGRPVDDESTLPPVDLGADETGTTLVVRATPGSPPPAATDPFAGSAG